VPTLQTVEMGAMGPVGGLPVASPAAAAVSSTMLSPGSHSPVPQSSIAPSPTHRLTNVPSPGVAPLNTPGWLLSSHSEYHL